MMKLMKLKFYMMFNCGEIQIRTLDDLRENFCVEDVLTNFEDGRLEKWLYVWHYSPELEAVRELKASGKTNAREILAELMRIFGADMDEAEIDSELEIYDYVEERRQFWEYVKSNGLHELEELRKKYENLSEKYSELETELGAFRLLYKVLPPLVKPLFDSLLKNEKLRKSLMGGSNHNDNSKS